MSPLSTNSSVDPTYPTFPVLACTGIVLILLPAYWHFKSGNVGTILYIVWAFIGNLNYLVNSISWTGNLHSPPWFWCDLSTSLIIALNVAIPTSSLLITHRLYSIASIREVNVSKNDSRRAKYYEVILGVGLPVLAVIFRAVVQGHRFDIVENVGCWPSIYVTPLTILMVFLPPILISLVSMVYASLAIRAFLKQRKQFSDVLQLANPGLTIGRYFRLMALAATEIICSLPTSMYVMVANLKNGLHPWISWADTHLNFNRVEFIPFGWFKLYPSAWILINLRMVGESGTFYRRQAWRLAQLLGFPEPCETLPSGPWISGSSASASSQLRSLPAFVSTVSDPSTTEEMKPQPNETGSKVHSTPDSLSTPLDFDDKTRPAVEHTHLPTVVPSAEVHSEVA
ncbi:a-factor receptor [Tulasnella sp. 417]|nr:a-factor receptor [Tulasnella sp. 417]